MICPHCNDAAVFEALKPVEFKPVVEGWKIDNHMGILPNPCLMVCLSCDGWVSVDVRSQLIRKHTKQSPVFDSAVKQIVHSCKQNLDRVLPESLKAGLRAAGYTGLHDQITGRETVLLVFEQKE